MSAAGLAQLGRLSRSASKTVAKAANGFHLFRIDGYSQTKTILPGERLSSQKFTVGGRSWRIDYYPNGRVDTPAARSNAVSVYLQFTDHTQRPLQARYKFSLLDHTGNAAYELPAETGSFTSVHKVVDVNSHFNTYPRFGMLQPPAAAVEEQGPGCGHEEFIGREELESRREDLIHDDRIVVRCDVGVTQIDSSCLAQDELSDEEEEEDHGYYGTRRRRRQRPRTDDDEYVKWCMTQEPRESQGRPQGQGGYRGDWY